MKALNLLMIEDNPDDVAIVRRLLSRSTTCTFNITVAEKLEDALGLTGSGSFDVILLDISLPDSFGENTFFKLRQHAPNIPIIVMTGCDDGNLINTTLQKGAQDYIIKDRLEATSLCNSINHAIERQRMINNLEKKTREIEMLTGNLKYLIDNSIDGMVITVNGVIRFVNPSALRILGCEYDNLIGTFFEYPIDTERPHDIEIEKCGGLRTLAEIRSVNVIWENEPACLSSIRDMTERIETEKRIQYLSFHDSLTGLYNRAFLEEEMQRLDTERQLPLSIIMGDANSLKFVNDVFGHDAGDDLLKTVASIIRQSCRKEDISVRIGGDEFVVFLPQSDEKVSEVIVGRIREKCENTMLACGIPVSIALGYAVKHDVGEDIKNVLKTAEERMYKVKIAESKNIRNLVLASLEKALHTKDYLTGEHERRTKELAVKFGERLGISDGILNDLVALASFHDIGKIIVPDYILKKDGPLDSSEWEIIKKHPEAGYRIIKEIKQMSELAEAILAHHEQWDGSGYPNGLKSDEIPLISRIMSIIDTYDVMCHDQPYRKAVNREEAINELRKCAGTQFDPELIEAFLDFLVK
jgi:diguanylate cyclase (GGDEF)-like protein